MRHPTDGVLRRLLDEPAGVADADRDHVRDCPVCLVGLAAAREDAATVTSALRADDEAAPDVGAAWARLSVALPDRSAVRELAPVRRRRTAVLRRPAAAALAVGLVLAGAGVAAANDWLPVFHTEKVAPVSIQTGDLVSLPDLSAYGDVQTTGQGNAHQVADAAAAGSFTGLAVPEVVQLPAGVSGNPTYQVVGQLSAVFTFSAQKAAAAAAHAGKPLPPVPAGLDGSGVRLVAGPGVAEVWGQAKGLPTLVVGRAVAPTAFSNGAPFATLRDYLLSLPGVSPELAAKLRTFTGDGTTLPLPVPADQVNSSTADVNGHPATVLVTKDQSMAAVVWVDSGVITAVAGAVGGDEVLAIAQQLR
ncbi:MAG TPA: hypothetical protein VGN28_11200 [Blastococcus sp.]|nr:hypothetical protein [Blastococcus sp.]